MNKTIKESIEFAKELKEIQLDKNIEAVICPPYTALGELAKFFENTSVYVSLSLTLFCLS